MNAITFLVFGNFAPLPLYIDNELYW